MDVNQIIAQLEDERDRITNAIAALRGSQATRFKTKRGITTGRHLSAASKRRISEQMKKRWAERKRSGKKGPLGVAA